VIPVRPRLESELHGNRTLHASRLYQAGKARLIVISGGNVFPQRQNIKPEAYYTAGILNDWGIPDEAILIETLSRNTHENAVQTSRLLQQRGIFSILLITAAVHMPRAYLCFEQAGLKVSPSPSGYSAASYDRPAIVALLPEAKNLQRTHQLIKENWVSLFIAFGAGSTKATAWQSAWTVNRSPETNTVACPVNESGPGNQPKDLEPMLLTPYPDQLESLKGVNTNGPE
jgi:hypothetical protein